ncbi:hypothetical protein NU219Hw_g8271t1 [Hortaea werneckii]
MYAGAGFYNAGKDEDSSPSLDTSQRSAKNATAEPFISPSRYSETTGTPDDDADCSDTVLLQGIDWVRMTDVAFARFGTNAHIILRLDLSRQNMSTEQRGLARKLDPP